MKMHKRSLVVVAIALTTVKVWAGIPPFDPSVTITVAERDIEARPNQEGRLLSRHMSKNNCFFAVSTRATDKGLMLDVASETCGEDTTRLSNVSIPMANTIKRGDKVEVPYGLLQKINGLSKEIKQAAKED